MAEKICLEELNNIVGGRGVSTIDVSPEEVAQNIILYCCNNADAVATVYVKLYNQHLSGEDPVFSYLENWLKDQGKPAKGGKVENYTPVKLN